MTMQLISLIVRESLTDEILLAHGLSHGKLANECDLSSLTPPLGLGMTERQFRDALQDVKVVHSTGIRSLVKVSEAALKAYEGIRTALPSGVTTVFSPTDQQKRMINIVRLASFIIKQREDTNRKTQSRIGDLTDRGASCQGAESLCPQVEYDGWQEIANSFEGDHLEHLLVASLCTQFAQFKCDVEADDPNCAKQHLDSKAIESKIKEMLEVSDDTPLRDALLVHAAHTIHKNLGAPAGRIPNYVKLQDLLNFTDTHHQLLKGDYNVFYQGLISEVNHKQIFDLMLQWKPPNCELTAERLSRLSRVPVIDILYFFMDHTDDNCAIHDILGDDYPYFSPEYTIINPTWHQSVAVLNAAQRLERLCVFNNVWMEAGFLSNIGPAWASLVQTIAGLHETGGIDVMISGVFNAVKDYKFLSCYKGPFTTYIFRTNKSLMFKIILNRLKEGSHLYNIFHILSSSIPLAQEEGHHQAGVQWPHVVARPEPALVRALSPSIVGANLEEALRTKGLEEAFQVKEESEESSDSGPDGAFAWASPSHAASGASEKEASDRPSDSSSDTDSSSDRIAAAREEDTAVYQDVMEGNFGNTGAYKATLYVGAIVTLAYTSKYAIERQGARTAADGRGR